MSEHTSFYQQPYSSSYRQGRRRWVPKGVMLLAILFVVGLLGACQLPSQPVAAIAVPVDSKSFTRVVGQPGFSVWRPLRFIRNGSIAVRFISAKDAKAAKPVFSFGLVNL